MFIVIKIIFTTDYINLRNLNIYNKYKGHFSNTINKHIGYKT